MRVNRKIYVSDATYDFIDQICDLYGPAYDDRNSEPHKSLRKFQRELSAQGIKISIAKIQKILVTGGKWSTVTSRRVAAAMAQYKTPSACADYVDMDDLDNIDGLGAAERRNKVTAPEGGIMAREMIIKQVVDELGYRRTSLMTNVYIMMPNLKMLFTARTTGIRSRKR